MKAKELFTKAKELMVLKKWKEAHSLVDKAMIDGVEASDWEFFQLGLLLEDLYEISLGEDFEKLAMIRVNICIAAPAPTKIVVWYAIYNDNYVSFLPDNWNRLGQDQQDEIISKLQDKYNIRTLNVDNDFNYEEDFTNFEYTLKNIKEV